VIDGQVSVNDYDLLHRHCQLSCASHQSRYHFNLHPHTLVERTRNSGLPVDRVPHCLFLICFLPERSRPLALLMIVLPFWINLLIRTYALKSVMGARGVINTVIGWVGIGPDRHDRAPRPP
jgi:hypothetical protein